MDLVQSYLSYVSAATVAPLDLRPPLALAVDLVGLAVALMNVRARPFAPAGARRLAWLAVLAGGLAPMLVTLGPWASAFTPLPASAWVGAAPGALLLALLLLGAAAGRLTRAGRVQPFAALLEVAGLLVVAVGLASVTLPSAAAAGWVDPAATLPAPSTGVSWGIALAGGLLVLAANASGGRISAVPLGRRVGTVLTALAYTLAVTGITFVPTWLGADAEWTRFALAAHVADALALLALAGAVRHMLNRPAAAEYWRQVGMARAQAHRGRARVASGPKPEHIAPAVTTNRKPAPVPTLSNLPRPIVPPSALAPFAPPALRRTTVYGPDVSATVQTADVRAGNVVPTAPVPVPPPTSGQAKGPLVAPSELRAAVLEPTNTLPAAGERAATKRENQAPEVEFSPQFVEAILTLQTEMLRAGRHYSFAELAELFTEVRPRGGVAMPRALGRAGALEALAAEEPAALLPRADEDGQAPSTLR